MIPRRLLIELAYLYRMNEKKPVQTTFHHDLRDSLPKSVSVLVELMHAMIAKRFATLIHIKRSQWYHLSPDSNHICSYLTLNENHMNIQIWTTQNHMNEWMNDRSTSRTVKQLGMDIGNCHAFGANENFAICFAIIAIKSAAKNQKVKINKQKASMNKSNCGFGFPAENYYRQKIGFIFKFVDIYHLRNETIATNHIVIKTSTIIRLRSKWSNATTIYAIVTESSF